MIAVKWLLWRAKVNVTQRLQDLALQTVLLGAGVEGSE